MRIDLDDKYVLCSDKYCCWVMEKKKGKKGKSKDKDYELRCSGYHRTFEELVMAHLDDKILASEAKNLKDIKDEIALAKKELKTWIENAAGK